MKKLVAFLAVAVLLIAAAAYAEPAVTAQTLPKAEDMVIDRDNYYGQILHGYYNYDCYVSEAVTRTAKFYIPEGTVYNQPTVFIMVPAGKDTWNFFVDSGWKSAADKYIFHVVLMETDKTGQWGSIDDELAYLSALRDDVSYRPFFVAFSANFYAIAYGNSADVLMQHAMANPHQWAAVAAVGATGVSDDYIAKMQSADSKETRIKVSQVQLPMFIVSKEKSDAVGKLVNYWTQANNSESTVYSCAYADEVYIPKPWTNKEAMDNEPVAKVYYTTAPVEKYFQADLIDKIYSDFFCKYVRYPGNGNGALRAYESIYDLGFKRFTGSVPGGFAADGSDLYNREWYVYVPDSVDPAKPAPVVFDLHGAGGSGDEIASRTGWIKVAKDRGCILVCPTASHILKVRDVSNMTTNELFRAMWSAKATEITPNDSLFLRYVYDWACENYNVDKGRVYVTGQSSGGMMSLNAAGYLSDIFTAAGAVSAYIEPDAEGYLKDHVIPVLAAIGEKDGSFKGGFGGERAQSLVEYWCGRYGLTKNWSDYTYMADDNCSYIAGNFRNYVFNTPTGVPMVRCIEVKEKTHAYLPSEAYLIWDEWFSLFHKDTQTGDLYYMNEKVELP